MITLDKSEGDKVIKDRIRGCLDDLIHLDEIYILIAKRILSDDNDLLDGHEIVRWILKHTCSDHYKCHVGTKDGELKCHIANNGYENLCSTQHSMKHLDVKHLKQACKVMGSIGLMGKDEDNEEWVIKGPCLQALKHYSPACASNGKISPWNGCFLGTTQSSQNLQFYTGYLVSQY